MSIKLYGPTGGSAFRCFWTAHELGLAYEHVPVNMSEREHKSEAYLAINPVGQVPALTDGDFKLAESLAINNYLCDVAQSDLNGKDAEERAKVWQWSLWVLLNVQPLFSTLAMPVWTNKHDEAAEAKAMETLTARLPILEQHLTDMKFMASDRFTVADINAAATFNYATLVNYDLSAYPRITAWLENVRSRPAYLAAKA